MGDRASFLLVYVIVDDARPTIMTTVLTSSFFILEWTAPPTATGNGISMPRYLLSFNGGSLDMRTTPFVVDAGTITITGTINVLIQPNYTMPIFMGSNAAAVLPVTIPSPDNGKYHQSKK